MTPEIPAIAVPGGKPVAEDRRVTAISELLQPCEQAAPGEDSGQCLNKAQPELGRLTAGHLDHRLRCGQAVGIEHDHGVIHTAPAADPVGNVTSLAFAIVAPVPIKNRAARRGRVDQGGEHCLFGDPYFRVIGVAEQEERKVARRSTC